MRGRSSSLRLRPWTRAVTRYRARPAPRESAAHRATSRHRTSTSSRRSTAWSGSRADRDRAVALEEDRRRRTARAARVRARRDPRRPAPALPELPERQERQARQEERRLGQGRGIRDLAGERQRHRRRQVGVGHRADVRARRVDREVDRQVGGRGQPARRDRLRAPGGRARRRRGRPPRARPCAGRSGSPAGGRHRAGPRGCPRRRR